MENWDNIDLNEAHIMWKDEGWARKYAAVYDEKYTYQELEGLMGLEYNGPIGDKELRVKNGLEGIIDSNRKEEKRNE